MKEGCSFCEILKRNDPEKILFKTRHFFVIFDTNPVNEGHMLIIPVSHVENVFDFSKSDWEDIPIVLSGCKFFGEEFNADGYNIGINCGEVAGQTVMHAHIHFIPRYKGDVENPEGGIRNFKLLIK